VRFGKVHVYNNLYEIKKVASYVYSWGVGIESGIYAENNLFQTDEDVTPDALIERFNGTAIHESGTHVGGPADKDLVDVLAAYNEANDPDLAGDVGWAPTLFTAIDPTRRVLPAVRSGAGPMEW
jgi:pectate lyase